MAKGVGEGDGFGRGVVFSTTPLFQSNFFPTFTQVNFLPFEIEVLPNFLQVDPELTAASAFSGRAIINRESRIKRIRTE